MPVVAHALVVVDECHERQVDVDERAQLLQTRTDCDVQRRRIRDAEHTRQPRRQALKRRRHWRRAGSVGFDRHAFQSDRSVTAFTGGLFLWTAM